MYKYPIVFIKIKEGRIKIKTLLCLLSTLTITASSILAVTDNSYYKKQYIKKRSNADEELDQPPFKKRKEEDNEINNSRVSLADAIEQTDLGEIPNDRPYTILQAARRFNPDLDINQLSIFCISCNKNDIQKWRIRPRQDSTLYSGTRNVQVRVTTSSMSKQYIKHLLATPLADVIKQTNLGELPDDNPETVWQRLEELNPNLNRNELSFLCVSNNNGAQRWTISARYNSLNYSGRRNIFFRSHSSSMSEQYFKYLLSVPLSEVIEQTDLGELPDNNKNTILQKLKRLNPNLDIDQLNIYFINNKSKDDAKTSNQIWIIRAKKNSLVYSGSKSIYFRVTSSPSLLQESNQLLTPLTDIIKQTDLGELPDDNKATILRRVKELNPDLDINQVDVDLILKNKDGNQLWRIISNTNNSIYSGTITVYFWIAIPSSSQEGTNCSSTPVVDVIGKTDLEKSVNAESNTVLKEGQTLSQQNLDKGLRLRLVDVLTNTDLGELPDNNKNAILERIKALNPDLDVEQINVSSSSKNKDGIKTCVITAKKNSINYIGKRKVKFYFSSQPQENKSHLDEALSLPSQNLKQVALSDIITRVDLNVLPTNDQRTVLRQVELLNPRLNIHDVTAIFSEIDDNGVIRWRIIPTENSNYTSEVEVYFTIRLNFIVNHVQVPEINLQNKLDSLLNQKDKNSKIELMENLKGCSQCNLLSMAEKQKILNEIDQQFQLTKIDIGNIVLNNEEHILHRAALLNHPLFSNSYFRKNFVFDSITRNEAIGHLQHNIFGEEECLHSLINSKTIFVINFTADNYTLNTFIPKQNLGKIDNNFEYTILKKIYELNPAIISKGWHLFIYYVRTSFAQVYIFNQNNKIIGAPIKFNFSTRNPILKSLQLNLNLGELPDNNIETIRTAFLQANPFFSPDNITGIYEIGTNSANIYGNVPTYSSNSSLFGKQNFMDSITVQFTLPKESGENNLMSNLAKTKPIIDKITKYDHDEL